MAWRLPPVSWALAAGLAATLALVAAEPRRGPAAVPATAGGASGPVAGETYAWKPVAIGGGGFITGLSQDARGRTLVARADVHGAYIWQPERDRWEQLVTTASMPAADRRQDGMNEGVYEIAVAPSDPARLYMAIKGAVYRSTDRGQHWSRGTMAGAAGPLGWNANGPYRFHGPFLAVDPRDPDLALVGTPGDGAWRTTDGGRIWRRIAALPASADLRPAEGVQTAGAGLWFDPQGRIWAMVAGRGMFVSADRGATFRPLPAVGGTGPALLRHGIFLGDGRFLGIDGEGQAIWRYDGRGWSRTGGDLTPRRWGAIAVDPRSRAIYLFDDGGRPWRSADGGDSWSRLYRRVRVGTGEPPWLHVIDQGYVATATAMFDATVPGRLWLASGAGPMLADTGGLLPMLTLTTQVRGIEELVTSDTVAPPGGAPLFAAWDFGIHRKPDLDAFSTTYGPKERVLIAAQQVDWSAGDPRFLVTNASDTRMGCCSEDGDAVLAGYSTDGGVSWARFPTLPQPPGTRADDPWRMAFGSIAVAADDTANIVWLPSFNRAPFYTRDRGLTWKRVTFPGEVLPFTGSHAAFHLPRRTLAADRVLPGTFYLLHSGEGANAALAGLWRTRDGGAVWQRVHGPVAPMDGFAAKLRPVPGKAGHLFLTASVMGDGDTDLRRSTDGGVTWTILRGVNHVDDIGFGKAAAGSAYPTIFLSGRVGGRYGLWRSTDDAATWRLLADFPLGRLDQVGSVEGDKRVFGRVLVGYQGSGWLYGEPARCTPAPFSPAASAMCAKVAD
jgi:photosystem II stability/assembly factor-like uncharacterized protein